MRIRQNSLRWTGALAALFFLFAALGPDLAKIHHAHDPHRHADAPAAFSQVPGELSLGQPCPGLEKCGFCLTQSQRPVFSFSPKAPAFIAEGLRNETIAPLASGNVFRPSPDQARAPPASV
jgi:hypothetical protein